MAEKLLTSITSLRSDDRGTSLLEFAFTAPIFVLMLVGLGDLARGMSEKYSLQQAANRTIERAYLGTPDDSYDYLLTQAANAATDAGATGATVALDKWVECDGTRKVWTDTCTSGQQTARYLTLTINSKFAPMFSSVGYPNVQADGKVPISVKASLRVQ